MPESIDPSLHVKPFVYETRSSKALHFSIAEIQSRMKLEDPHALDLEYTRMMMAFLLFRPDPKQIAMIGLGGGSLAKFCHRFLREARIHVVEINPHVIALRDEFHVPPDDERFRVIPGDGAKYVRYGAMPCDVLMVDGLPDRLCSQRFYDDACDMLQPGGVLVANLHREHIDYPDHVERIRRSFRGALLAVDDSERSNSIVFACKGPALNRFRLGGVRPPKGLDKEAASQLAAAFARVSAAWKDQRA